MKMRIIPAIIATILWLPTSGISGTEWDQAVSGISRIGGGFNTLDLEKFNTRMEELGLPDFSEAAPGIIINKAYWYRRFVMESELNALLWRTRVQAGKASSLFSGWWGIDWGFSLFPQESILLVYPWAGIGLGGIRLHFHDRSAAFEDVLANEPYNVSLWQAKFFITVGLNAEVVLNLPRKGYRTIGLRAGYMFDVTESNEWDEFGVDVGSGPSPSLDGVYVRLVLGRYHRGFSPWPK